MPLISFTTADVLRAKNLEAGWYGSKITATTGPKVSAAGDSYNFTFDFTLDDKSPTPGKIIQRVFNSKAIGMLIPVIAAIRGGVSIEPKDFQFDTDEALMKSLDIKLAVDVYEGQPKNIIVEFAPYGKGTDQKAPF